MPLATIAKLLGTSAELKALGARAEKTRALQALYVRCAPRSLERSSRVKSCRAGTLVICADNAATAAKLRQLGPTLLACVQADDPSVGAIKIEVEVADAARRRIPEARKKPLTPHALSEFQALSRALPEGGLKSAVAKLVQRHAKKR